jgi:hypothetical protein
MYIDVYHVSTITKVAEHDSVVAFHVAYYAVGLVPTKRLSWHLYW